MASSTSPAQTLASHLVSQAIASVSLLESLAIISAEDAAVIRSKLPSATSTFPTLESGEDISRRLSNLTVNSNAPSQTTTHSTPQTTSAPVRHQMVSPAVQPQRTVSPAQSPPLMTAQSHRTSLPMVPQPAVEDRAQALWDYAGVVSSEIHVDVRAHPIATR